MRDFVLVYCSIVRSTVEYASPAWAALPQYLSNMLESVQKQAMQVIFPGFLYEDTLDLALLRHFIHHVNLKFFFTSFIFYILFSEWLILW